MQPAKLPRPLGLPYMARILALMGPLWMIFVIAARLPPQCPVPEANITKLS